jgi:hypothetical protein
MKRVITFLLLHALISTSYAGESILIGKAANGYAFEFSNSSVQRTEKELSADDLKGIQRFDLHIQKETPAFTIDPKTKKSVRITVLDPKSIASEIPVPCVWRDGFIICDSDAPHGLANVRYQYDRTIGSGGGFRCIQGCSRRVPSVLRYEGVESGC